MEIRPGIESSRSRLARGLAKLGTAGLVFFLLKGLAWVLVPLAIAYWSGR